MPILLIAAAAALIGALAWWAYHTEQKRRAAFRAWAGEHGFAYLPDRDRSLARHYSFLDKLDRGSNRYVYDLLEGAWGGRPAALFGYHYQTSDGKRTYHFHISVAVLRLERRFPELTVAPQGWFDGLFGSDIDFESVEFSRRFRVGSDDKRFAYDFCHARMMEHLLQHPNTTLELEGDALALIWKGRPRLEDLEPALERLRGLRARMPDYLFRDPGLAAAN